jgi:hypothetical protein
MDHSDNTFIRFRVGVGFIGEPLMVAGIRYLEKLGIMNICMFAVTSADAIHSRCCFSNL